MRIIPLRSPVFLSFHPQQLFSFGVWVRHYIFTTWILVTYYRVGEDLLLQDFQEIQKQTLLNFLKILKKCFLISVGGWWTNRRILKQQWSICKCLASLVGLIIHNMITCSRLTDHNQYTRYNSTKLSRDSEVFVSEYLQDLKDMFHWYYMHSDADSSTKIYNDDDLQ